jgi:hypothetical protein
MCAQALSASQKRTLNLNANKHYDYTYSLTHLTRSREKCTAFQRVDGKEEGQKEGEPTGRARESDIFNFAS